MDRPSLSGTEGDLSSLTEWLQAMERLRVRLGDLPDADRGALTPIRELAKDMSGAENRLRAQVGLPPLMH